MKGPVALSTYGGVPDDAASRRIHVQMQVEGWPAVRRIGQRESDDAAQRGAVGSRPGVRSKESAPKGKSDDARPSVAIRTQRRRLDAVR